jgi:hypothetical protein
MGLHTYDYWARALVSDAEKCLRSGEQRLRFDLVNDNETGGGGHHWMAIACEFTWVGSDADRARLTSILASPAHLNAAP